MAEFSLEFGEDRGVIIVRTQGYLDKEGGKEFLEGSTAKLAPAQTKLILNFAGSPVINSSGMAAIITLIDLVLDQDGGMVAITGISNLVKVAFRATGILLTVSDYPDEASASEALLQG